MHAISFVRKRSPDYSRVIGFAVRRNRQNSPRHAFNGESSAASVYVRMSYFRWISIFTSVVNFKSTQPVVLRPHVDKPTLTRLPSDGRTMNVPSANVLANRPETVCMLPSLQFTEVGASEGKE